MLNSNIKALASSTNPFYDDVFSTIINACTAPAKIHAKNKDENEDTSTK